MTLRIEIPQEEIAHFCRRWRIRELAIFGSALREDFRPDSDWMYWLPLSRKSTGDFTTNWR
jgi:predicted nucleotidyltransferase